jgi:uncharacterized protein YraI
MTVMTTSFRKAIVSVVLIATAMLGQARAESHTTSFTTYLHIGPGRQYAVSDEVPTGTTVDVVGCENNWCQIRYGAAAGWIEQRMLAPRAQPARSGTPASDCADFARTGWPNSGDHERICSATTR